LEEEALAGSSRAQLVAEEGRRATIAFGSKVNGADLQSVWHCWHFWARPEQIAPDGNWHIWLILAGRGFGKTRAGAEWVREVAMQDNTARIALVAANLAEARSVMVEGESGLLAISAHYDRPIWEPSLRRLKWPGGAVASIYSAGEPESLRGPQHSHAWCDEIAKWDSSSGRSMAAWDNLAMGLRLGSHPQIVATTTPRAVPLLRQLVTPDPLTVVTTGRTYDNRKHLPKSFLESMARNYEGTLLGRQELDGELLEEVEGALWNREMLERCRIDADCLVESDRIRRIIIGVDPPVSAHGDSCGIIVAGLPDDGRAIVLADCSVDRPSPERWARAVADSFDFWKADRVIAEANQGGEMVRAVLQAAAINLPVRLVHASRNKVARAEPVAALYEAGRVGHAGMFAALEDQMCGLVSGGAYMGPGRSPDRADALVWALSALMLGHMSEPMIRSS